MGFGSGGPCYPTPLLAGGAGLRVSLAGSALVGGCDLPPESAVVFDGFGSVAAVAERAEVAGVVGVGDALGEELASGEGVVVGGGCGGAAEAAPGVGFEVGGSDLGGPSSAVAACAGAWAGVGFASVVRARLAVRAVGLGACLHQSKP